MIDFAGLQFTILAIAINIDPDLARFGQFVFAWHGVFSAIGVIVGVSLGVSIAASAGANEDHAYTLALLSVAGGIIGARLFHVLDKFEYYREHPEQIILVSEGGIAIYGGIVGGVITGALYAKLRGINLAAVADGGGIGLIIGQAIGRIGDVINGEHHGVPFDAWWAVVYTHPNTLGVVGQPVHLAVGYELLWGLLIFALLMTLRSRYAGTGRIFWLYVLLYGIGRFWVSFYRVDTLVLAGLSQAQIIAIIGVVLSIGGLIWTTYIRPIQVPDRADLDDEELDDNELDESANLDSGVSRTV